MVDTTQETAGEREGEKEGEEMNRQEYEKCKEKVTRAVSCLTIYKYGKIEDCSTCELNNICKKIHRDFNKKTMLLKLDDAIVFFEEKNKAKKIKNH